MTIGTKSVLYGAHCFLIHPFFLAAAWLRLYGLRAVEDPYVGSVSIFNWRLWVAFCIHDLGYLGKQNMDGEEGEAHPYWAGKVILRFSRKPWHDFVVYHSRFLAKKDGMTYSLLCVADKMALAMEPRWFYLVRVVATGEIREYMALAGARNAESKYAEEPQTKYESAGLDLSTRWSWCTNMQEYVRNWAFEHRLGKVDTWTPDASQRQAADETGVWK